MNVKGADIVEALVYQLTEAALECNKAEGLVYAPRAGHAWRNHARKAYNILRVLLDAVNDEED